MTLFPERKPAPAVPAHLRWQYGEILHDDGETLKVWADVYELANGWTWSAKAHGYHREHDGTFRPVRQTEGGAAATPDRPARGALALRCEHGNQWGWLTMCRLGPSDVVWCSPVLDGCTVEMSRSEPSP